MPDCHYPLAHEGQVDGSVRIDGDLHLLASRKRGQRLHQFLNFLIETDNVNGNHFIVLEFPPRFALGKYFGFQVLIPNAFCQGFGSEAGGLDIAYSRKGNHSIGTDGYLPVQCGVKYEFYVNLVESVQLVGAKWNTPFGLIDDAERWRKEAGRFQNDLLRSIEKVIADKHLSYIPGSVEWADFDPTATSNAIAMLDFADSLPNGPLHAMLDTYLDGFHRKHRGEMPWNNYTAYEIRIIGAFVRLGKRATANELLEFFLSDRRPREWNQWPEITWRDPRSPGHLGDVPHTWIAAEYLLALASMVAAEREASASLVLASGMPWAWISQENGFSVSNLPTRFGALDFRIIAIGNDSIHVEVGGPLSLPPGGLTIAPPLPPGMRIAGGGVSITVESLPFQAVLQLSGQPR